MSLFAVETDVGLVTRLVSGFVISHDFGVASLQKCYRDTFWLSPELAHLVYSLSHFLKKTHTPEMIM